MSSTKKQRSASPSQAMPRSAFSASTRATRSRRFSSSRGSAGWLGKVPSSSKYRRVVSSGSRSKIARAPTAPMPFAVSSTSFSRGMRETSTKDRQWSAYSSLSAATSSAPVGGASVGVAVGHEPLADLAEPLVARERERSAAHHLDPVPLLRVVRGGDDRAALEVVPGDVVVQHVGRDDADVGDGGAPGAGSGHEAGGELGGRQPAVATDGDVSRAEVVDERAADAPEHLGVELLGVETPDVVGLEDSRARSSSPWTLPAGLRVVGHDAALAEERSAHERVLADPHAGADEARLDDRVSARLRPGPQNAVADERARADTHVAHQHRVGPERGRPPRPRSRGRRRRAARARPRVRCGRPLATKPPRTASASSATRKRPCRMSRWTWRYFSGVPMSIQ